MATEPANDPNSAPEVDPDQPEAEEEGAETPEGAETDPDQPEEAEEGHAEGEDDLEDYEIEGKAYRIPKALKPHLLMDRDYRRKTQTLAEERRAFEKDQTSLQERSKAFEEVQSLREQNFKDIAKLVNMDERLAEYSKVDWDRLHADDPVAYTKKFGDYTLLRNQRSDLANQVAAKHQEANTKAERERATRYSDFVQALPREIPDWSPELNAEVSGVFERLGFSRDEITKLADIRMIKLARLASKGAKIEQQQRQNAANPKPPSAKPVAQVGARTPPVNRMSDRAPVTDWMAARKKQVAAAGKR